jgi:hypothetical protein
MDKGLGMDNAISRIHKRQTARLLHHLEETGQLTEQLRSDILRSHGFIFEDVSTEIERIKQGNGKDKNEKTLQ